MSSDVFEADFYLSVGDRQPALQVQLLDGDGNPVDLTGATVAFSMASCNGLITGLGGSASIAGAPALGTVIYAWQSQDTAIAGDFTADLVVTFADGTQMTVPSDKPIGITIRARV